MKITIYTVNDCQFSKQEKEYLTSHSLQFEEKNLETNREWLQEMLAVSNNFAGTPVTKIEKDNGQTVVMKGFTKEDFDKELGLASAPMQADAPAQDAPAVPQAPTPPAPTMDMPSTPPTAPPEPPAIPTTPEPPQQTVANMSTAPEPPQQNVPTAPQPTPPAVPTPEPTLPPIQTPSQAPPVSQSTSNPALTSVLDQLQSKSDGSSQASSMPHAYN